MSKVREALLKAHPLPWSIIDPNGDRFGYRPIMIQDKNSALVLRVGDAGQNRHILVLAEFLVETVNRSELAEKAFIHIQALVDALGSKP